MKVKWDTKPFEECLDQIGYPNKVQRRNFQETGKFPIISQESDFINGYWDNKDDVLRVDRPLVVFGDHTQVLKYVDFDFVLGADGVKLLKPKTFIDPKFFYYFLMAHPIEGVGYARHYRFLKELTVSYPPLSEQQRIVAILEQAFAGLATATANAQKNLKNAGELFDSYLNSVFTGKADEWKTTELGKDVKFVDYRGKTPPKMEAGIRLITAKNVKMNRIQREPEEFIDPSIYDEWMTRGYPKKGDVLFTTEAPLGNVAQLDTDETVVIGQRLITMQPVESILDRTFLKYALMSRPTQEEIFKRGTGATVVGIKASLLKQVPISFPSKIADQKALANAMEMNANYVVQLENNYRDKLSELLSLKQSILQRAFSGELPLPQNIKEAAE